jgi:hypothetical protein
MERLVGFGMAHWLPGDESSVCELRWRRSAAASSPECPSGAAGSMTGCSACTSTGSPWPTPTGLSSPTVPRDRPHHRLPRPSPAPPPRHHPGPRPPTMTVPPGSPDAARPSSPAGRHRRPEPTDPARTPLQGPLRGTCQSSPERDPDEVHDHPVGRRHRPRRHRPTRPLHRRDHRLETPPSRPTTRFRTRRRRHRTVNPTLARISRDCPAELVMTPRVLARQASSGSCGRRHRRPGQSDVAPWPLFVPTRPLTRIRRPRTSPRPAISAHIRGLGRTSCTCSPGHDRARRTADQSTPTPGGPAR